MLDNGGYDMTGTVHPITDGVQSGATRRMVIITGASSGIGKAAAMKFASQGDHVVMACRNVESGEQARAEVLTAAAGVGSAEVMRLDVSSRKSILSFAEAFADWHPRLDVLIHNAGYFNHGIRAYQLSGDGAELTFATNVFGPHLLTERLLGVLSRSADARVLTAGSTAIKNFFDPRRAIEFDNLRGEHADDRPYSVYRMYQDSKMGLLLLTRAMAAAYADRGVKVNCVMIPVVRIEKRQLKKFRSWFRVIAPLYQYYNPFARPPSRLAETYYRICTGSEFRQTTGELIDHRLRVLPPASPDRPLTPIHVVRELAAPTMAPAYAGDPANVQRMWELSLEVIRQSA
jgi:NAD(P)-dependent dehydrogenase (short-subunit alcohol dehydrogenase family)